MRQMSMTHTGMVTYRRIIVGTTCLAVTTLLLARAAGQDEAAGSDERDTQAPTTQPTPRATEESRILSGLIGSKHDFSLSDRHPRDLCLPCHAPHLPTGEAPLLDKRPVAAQPVRTYQSIDTELDRASLLCLSCHDGIVAADVFTSSHATSLASQLGASQLGAGPLRGHPVGVEYPIAEPEYQPKAAVEADASIRLPDGRIQCITCHDPHNTAGHAGMLNKSNERSRLCLTCHRL